MAIPPPKAYKNLDFLNSPDARTIRILAEYLEPQSRFEREQVNNSIVFFGSARFIDREVAKERLDKARKAAEANPSEEAEQNLQLARKKMVTSEYYEDARELARLLTEWSLQTHEKPDRYYIASGGGPGIMEAANRGASEVKGGESIGLNISLPMEQGCNPYITDKLNFEFHYFFTRKFWFMYMAKALVIFPGGFGTLDEMFEGLTLIQTEKSNPNIPVVLYAGDYWRKVINLEALSEAGTISPKDLELFEVIDTPAEAFEYLKSRLSGE